VESFSRPSVTVAAAVLGLIALVGFAVGFKGAFSRPGEIEPSFTTAPGASNLGEPTQARALTEPIAPPVQVAASSTPKSAAKPKPADDDDDDDTASSSAPPPQIVAPPPVIVPTPPPAPAADDDLPPH
jgi:hypothetical protein